jgi:hypothetical protein
MSKLAELLPHSSAISFLLRAKNIKSLQEPNLGIFSHRLGKAKSSLAWLWTYEGLDTREIEENMHHALTGPEKAMDRTWNYIRSIAVTSS